MSSRAGSSDHVAAVGEADHAERVLLDLHEVERTSPLVSTTSSPPIGATSPPVRR
jgi:hypothetical protein